MENELRFNFSSLVYLEHLFLYSIEHFKQLQLLSSYASFWITYDICFHSLFYLLILKLTGLSLRIPRDFFKVKTRAVCIRQILDAPAGVIFFQTEPTPFLTKCIE